MAVPHAQAVAYRQNVSHGHGNAPQPVAMPHSKPVHKQWRDHVWPRILVPGQPMPAPGIRGTGETRRTRGPGSAEAAGARGRAGNPAAAAAGSSEAAVSFCCTAWGWGWRWGPLVLIPWPRVHGPMASGPQPTAPHPSQPLLPIPPPCRPVTPGLSVPAPRSPQHPTPHPRVPCPAASGSRSCRPPSSVALQPPSLPPRCVHSPSLQHHCGARAQDLMQGHGGGGGCHGV